jgi:hypothetical protein
MVLKAKADGQSHHFDGGNKSLGEAGSEDEASDWMTMTSQQSLYKSGTNSSLLITYTRVSNSLIDLYRFLLHIDIVQT